MANKEEILINSTPQETRCALLENGVLQEYHLERTAGHGIVGNIYKGKIVRVLPGMQAAFVDIGLERNGFLHIADLIQSKLTKGSPTEAPRPQIEQLLHQGETVWVQAMRDPSGTKGARLTTNLSVPSRNLVYLPRSQGVAVSQQINDQQERQRLQSLLAELANEHSLEGGFILRTQAEHVSAEDLSADLVYLSRLWVHLRTCMQEACSPTLLHEDSPLLLRFLRDYANAGTTAVKIDSPTALAQSIEFAQDFLPDLLGRIEGYEERRPLFDHFDIEESIQAAMRRRVELRSGGDLVIEHTEAMTVIDVNTGSFVGRDDQQETWLQTNLEAAEAIAHQLRLRNISGIIIVDFIDLHSEQYRQQLLQTLRDALAKDRVRTRVSDISSLGLVEITRKRARESLAQLLCESCTVCEGHGMVKTAQTVCYEILREIRREDSQYKAQAYTVIAAPAVINLMLEAEAASLADLQEQLQRPIKLQADSHYHQQQYDIALN
ncbi:MAG: Rne/Rng family ribonuclease [Pseudomonadota bacterium]